MAEVMIAMAASAIILGGLLISSTQLQRALYSSERYASNQTTQRRLIDYLSRDLRRAIGIATTTTVGGSGGTPIAGQTVSIENGVSLLVTLPPYYQTNDAALANYDASFPVVAGNNRVDYGDSSGPAPSVQVVFQKVANYGDSGACFVRIEGGIPQVIISHAEALHVQLTLDANGFYGSLAVTFSPTASGARTVIHDRFLLRNLRTDL